MSSEYSSEVMTKPLSKRSIFSGIDKSGLRNYLSSSKISLEIPEEVERLRKLKYQNAPLSDSSTEGEVCDDKASHVDSEDSGLFKEGYFLKRSSSRLGKSQVDQEVSQWKKAAEKHLNELTSEYSKGNKKNVSLAIPLGLEMNGKIGRGISEEDSSFVSKSLQSSRTDSADELDDRRNEEFVRDVRRVLRSKKNPETLAKRNLQEEYGRQLSKKMVEVCRWAQHRFSATTGSEQRALPEIEDISNTDNGAGGDNTSGGPAQGIFEQLSQMVLRNKISKRSKAAQTRKQILKRAEEKRENLVELSKFSEVEEDQVEIPVGDIPRVKKVRFLDECGERDSSKSPKKLAFRKLKDNIDTVVQKDNNIAVYAEKQSERMSKVENYLASNQDSNSSGEECWNDDVLTPEEENYVFDRLAGEFLKSVRSQCSGQGQISQNDKQLLTFLVKKFIDRGELSVIDEMLKESVDSCKMSVPPCENAKDREQYFLKMLVRKYIKRGMRTVLEDKIAWIYYRTEASKKKPEERTNAQDERLGDGEILVQRLVQAFASSSGNSSLNRLVDELVQERLRVNANTLEGDKAADSRNEIRDMIVARFARMYLDRTPPGSNIMNKRNADGAHEEASNANGQLGKGVEHFIMNGRPFEVQWTASGFEDDADEPFKEEFPSTKQQEREDTFRLQDRFWNKQQVRLTQPSGKPRRFCTPVMKRGISLIGGSKATQKTCRKTNRKHASSVEDLRKHLRSDNIRWLTEQKNKLWEARNKEAKRIDKFTMSLPHRMEQVIQRRDRFQKELIDRETSKMKGRGNMKNPRS